MTHVRVFQDKVRHIISAENSLEQVVTEFDFVEGPIWLASEGCLLFSDIPANVIYQWDMHHGTRPYRRPSGNSNGLAVDTLRRLIACEHGNRRVTRANLHSEVVESIATHYQGKRLNSPNDVVVKSDGAIYFTDPPYGLASLDEQELDFQGVYRLDPNSGQLTLLVDDFDRPNGLAFSPDERILYINDSNRQHVRAFDVQADGTLDNGRLFTVLDPEVGPGVPDGLKVDTEGTMYVTGPGGVWIVSATGEQLGIILVPEVAANLAFGDEDGRTLYIAASTSIYRIRLTCPESHPVRRERNRLFNSALKEQPARSTLGFRR